MVIAFIGSLFAKIERINKRSLFNFFKLFLFYESSVGIDLSIWSKGDVCNRVMWFLIIDKTERYVMFIAELAKLINIF
jgi:hypothetical protein